MIRPMDRMLDKQIATHVAAIEPIQPSPVTTAEVIARTVSGEAFETAQPTTTGCERHDKVSFHPDSVITGRNSRRK